MKSLVFHTDTLIARAIEPKLVHWVVQGPRGPEVRSKMVLVTSPPTLVEMLREVDDGLEEIDVRDAVAAASLAGDWKLAESLAARYSLQICLRCAADMANRPGVHLATLIDIEDCWGEVCGGCAVKMIEDDA